MMTRSGALLGLTWVVVLVMVGGTPAGAVPPPGGQGDPSPPFSLEMNRLDLVVDVDQKGGTLRGRARYTIRNGGDAPVDEASFNLGRLMTVIAAEDDAGRALPVRQDVVTFVDFDRLQVDHVVVRLPATLPPGASTRIALEYEGPLVGYTETGSLYVRDRIDETFSILRTDAFAWPVPGTLSVRENRSAPRSDFDFTARVTVAEGFTVASGGRLVGVSTEDGRSTFTYESVAPTPFLNLPIARYEVLAEDGVRVVHFPADSLGARRVLDRALAGLRDLSDKLGPLETRPQLTIVEIPEGWGSQASLTGGIIQTADVFRDAGSGSQLYHELSHLWNPPDLDQPSARWNEGLATFLAARMADALDGRGGMDDEVRRSAARLVTAAESERALAQTPFLRYGEAGMTDRAYRVGFLMFHALHEALGADRFYALIGAYERDHRADGATFVSLMDTLERGAGAELAGFFDVWVRSTAWLEALGAGVPPAEVGRLER